MVVVEVMFFRYCYRLGYESLWREVSDSIAPDAKQFVASMLLVRPQRFVGPRQEQLENQ
jgi:hypothetical protein